MRFATSHFSSSIKQESNNRWSSLAQANCNEQTATDVLFVMFLSHVHLKTASAIIKWAGFVDAV